MQMYRTQTRIHVKVCSTVRKQMTLLGHLIRFHLWIICFTVFSRLRTAHFTKTGEFDHPLIGHSNHVKYMSFITTTVHYNSIVSFQVFGTRSNVFNVAKYKPIRPPRTTMGFRNDYDI